MIIVSLFLLFVSAQCRPGNIQGGPVEDRSSNIITHIPYYGGAKGQTLEIIESPDGTVKTNIIPTKYQDAKPESQFAKDIKTIHQAALDIIRLHEQTKNKPSLDSSEQERYDQGIELLNASSGRLAQSQSQDPFQSQQSPSEPLDTEERSNLKFWFEKKKDKYGGKNSGEDKEDKEEENVGEETGENGEGEGVAINLPPPDASVAEAKPVGLAVAGPGGVAASKPIATAVVGPGGLAIARPVATAIAGVAPEDAIIPLSADGYLKLPEKKKDRCKEKKCDKEEKKPAKDEEYDGYDAYRIREELKYRI